MALLHFKLDKFTESKQATCFTFRFFIIYKYSVFHRFIARLACMKARWHRLFFFLFFSFYVRIASVTENDSMKYAAGWTHWKTLERIQFVWVLCKCSLSLSLLTSRIELAAWCKQYRTFFTKCKITAMMSLSFGNVSGNSSIWFALSLLSCTLYTSWLFGCFVFCFYFIKFHFFVFCICLYLLMLQHISKGLKLSRTRSMYFFFRTYNGTTYTK